MSEFNKKQDRVISLNWENISTYSKGDKERTPKSWRLKVGDFYILIHRHIHYPKDMWLLSSEPFFDKYEMPNKDIDECKMLAVDLVKTKLLQSLSHLQHNKT